MWTIVLLCFDSMTKQNKNSIQLISLNSIWRPISHRTFHKGRNLCLSSAKLWLRMGFYTLQFFTGCFNINSLKSDKDIQVELGGNGKPQLENNCFIQLRPLLVSWGVEIRTNNGLTTIKLLDVWGNSSDELKAKIFTPQVLGLLFYISLLCLVFS